MDANTPFIQLSDARARERARAGGKAAELARLEALGLPTPPGAVLPAGASRPGEAACARLAADLAPDGAALAVRSSVACEDGADASFAGQFASVLGVRGGRALHEALATVRASYAAARIEAYEEALAANRDSRSATFVEGATLDSGGNASARGGCADPWHGPAPPLLSQGEKGASGTGRC
ncbi:MAG: hypothetical protein M5U26_30060 [Planctomycetota bacterium]|nr:hypothetical protein [Planctomycetota bacterium]